MEKRTLIALALSFAVLGSYPMIMRKMYPDYYKRLAAEEQAKKQGAKTGTVAPGSSTTAIAAPVSVAGAPLNSPILKENADRTLSTGKADLVYTESDGSIRKASFPLFAHPDTKKPLTIFDRTTAGAGSLGVLFPQNPDSLPRNVVLQAQGKQVSVQGQSSDGRFRFSQVTDWDGYTGKVRVSVENATGQDQRLAYGLSLGETLIARDSIDAQYLETNFYERRPDGKNKLSHIKEHKAGKVVASTAPVEWAATKDRHFALIVKPLGEDSWTARVTGLGQQKHHSYLLSPEIILAANGRIEHEFTVYAGPVEIDQLTPLGLDAIVNFGKLDGIGRLLVGALEMIQKLVRNYGIAIIVLTALINILLFPLTRASFLSMKRMQDVQPQMAKIREQHKNNPERQNKEMMELYKKHKVNPFGGCLPMLLQMPVFIALYVALSKSVILINAHFLWIDDLSAPDRVGLPFTAPVIGNELHVLPLVMSAGMFFQQKLSSASMAGQDPMMAQQQKMMSVMMPIIFCFIFYSMPSGLVLYWLTNTVIMTTYQFILKKKSPAPAV